MIPAVKHFDPVLGIDVHIVLVPTPAGPVPTPVPHPFVGILFDPLDYIWPFAATVFVNGLPRAQAGTGVLALPTHVPMVGAFLVPPGNEGELFMGSSTVLVEDEPMGYGMLPVLTCQDVGLPAPLRLKRPMSPRSLLLPTSLALPIPSGPLVLVGGAPTVSLSALAMHALGPLARQLKKGLRKARAAQRASRRMKGASRYLNQVADKVFDRLGISKQSKLRNQVSTAICTVTGHPVDVPTGKVFTDFVDLTLPGPLPFPLERVWFSTSTYDGPLGHGWHASFDMALVVEPEVSGLRLRDGRVVLFPPLSVGASHFDRAERMTLHRDAHGYALTDAKTGAVYHFATVEGRDDMPLVQLANGCGPALHFSYDSRGLLREIGDSAQRRWTFRYSGPRIAAIEGPHPDELGRRVTYMRYAYDALGNLVETRDALGHTQQFAFERHLLVRETNKNGLSFYFTWDGRDEGARCTRTWGDGGIYDHKLTYDLAGNVTVVENSLGFKTRHEHDGSMVHRTVDARGCVSATEYGPGYEVVAEVDQLGQRTAFAYDQRGNLIETVRSDGSRVCVTCDECDRTVAVVDPVGGIWRCERDEHGRVVRETNPLGQSTRSEYRGPLLAAVTDAAGTQTSFTYDAQGNLHTVTAANGAITRYGYDQLGRTIAITDAVGNVQRRELDLLGRVLRVLEPDGNVRSLRYDAEGNVVRSRDGLQDVLFHYAGMGRLIARSEAGTSVRFTYDTEEQLTSLVNEHGHVYRFVLGPTGDVEEERGFDGLTRRYQRDAAGRVTRVNRPDERFTLYTHDPLGRVIGVEHSDESKESYVYRADGALLEATNDACSVRFSRDALGRVVREQQGEHWVESTYDARGLRTTMRSSAGIEQTIDHDAMGYVVRVAEASSGFEARFARDFFGRELERILPGGLTSQWHRDSLGRPLKHIVQNGARTERAIGYKWGFGDRLHATIDGHRGTTAYGHDARGNLAWARYPDGVEELRMPDAVGNLFRTKGRTDRTYGPAGQLLSARTEHGETRYVYDGEGNLVGKHEPGGRAWRYAWNGAGMLGEATRPDDTAVTFVYDALGRRIAKTYGGQTTRWVWDGNVPLHEWVEGELDEQSANAGERVVSMALHGRRSAEKPLTWLFEPSGFAPMARLRGDGALALVCDHLGTPVIMAASHGARPWHARIGTWGDLHEVDGVRSACPFRWPGQYEDTETGLHYNRFRYYDAEAGQYASQDPIGLLGGLAAYGYVHDPLSWQDSLGLSGSCGEVALDANAVTGALERGQMGELVAALRGRSPVVSFRAAKEFVRGAPSVRTPTGRQARAAQLRAFLGAHDGRVGAPASDSQALANQIATGRANIGRHPKDQLSILSEGDAHVLSSAEADRLPLLTRDRRLRRVMDAFGLPSESY